MNRSEVGEFNFTPAKSNYLRRLSWRKRTMVKGTKLATLGLVVLALLLGTSTLAASAAGAFGADPAHALGITNHDITVPANGALWYSFNYAGDRSQIMITLASGSNNGMAFDIWTPTQAAALTDEKPIGKGSVQNINCDTGIVQRKGKCQLADLFWQGGFNASGIYYVEVFNNQSVSLTTTLTVQGTGVALLPAMANNVQSNTTSTAVQSNTQPSFRGGAAPPSASIAGPTNVDLQHAALVDNQSITVPSNTILWYRFDYAGSAAGNPSVITITLANGNSDNLAFSLWTPEQAADMTDQVAIGKGTPSHLDCSLSSCPSADLTWKGSFHTPGTYYIEVFNSNPNAVTVGLLVQGDGVILAA